MKRAIVFPAILALAIGMSAIVIADENESNKPVSAKEVLAASLNTLQAPTDESVDSLEQPSDAVWQAEFTDANKTEWFTMKMFADKWGKGFCFETSESVWSQPRVATDDNGVVLEANPWSGGGYWDMSSIVYTATEAGTYELAAGNYKTISSVKLGEDSYSLSAEGGAGLVAIYKNDIQIWPEEEDWAIIKHGAPVDFPTLTIQLAAGDKVRIEGVAGKDDGTLGQGNPNAGLPSGGNRILLDPVITKTPSQTTSDESTTSQESTTSEDSGTVSPESTVSEAPKGTTVSARADLLKSLEAGDVLADCAWKPVFTNANSVDWNEMTAYAETFSFSGNWSLPYVWMPENGGVVLNANQWATGGPFWDKAGISYTSPKAQKVVLKAGDIKTISAGTETALSTVEGRVAIYKNGAKIWPKDKDFVSVKQGVSVDFPELELTLKKGDVIVIEGYGAKVGGEINDDVGGSWENQILMDPVIFIPDDQSAGNNPGTGVSSLPLFIGALLCAGAAGAVVCARKRRA